MAASDKNIIITPNRGGATAEPEIFFGGSGNNPIRLKVLDDSTGTLSFEGSAGQLFSINNSLTSGSIFSVNDVSGIPSIDVNADGTVLLAPFGGTVGIRLTSPQTAFHADLGAAGRATLQATAATVGSSLNMWNSNPASIAGAGMLFSAGGSVNQSDSFIGGVASQRIDATGNSRLVFRIRANDALTDTSTSAPFYVEGGDAEIKVIAAPSSNHLFGIGTTTPTSKLSIAGSVLASDGFRVGSGAINAQTAGYSLVVGDNGKIITMNSASAITLTAGTAVGTTGFSCSVVQLGAGQVTIAGSGVTLNSFSGLKIAGQHGTASIVCYATNTLNVAGNLTP